MKNFFTDPSFIVPIFLYSVGGVMVSIVCLFANNGHCTYETVAAYTNPGYIVTCELFRPRFK